MERTLRCVFAPLGRRFAPAGQFLTLWAVAGELSRQLTRIFLRDDTGRRPVYGSLERFQSDPNWRDLLLFHEYFHSDTGAGLGASHQTGWTGLVTKMLQQSGEVHGQRKSTECMAAAD